MRNPKPAPVVVRTLCSLCDQDWDAHGENPTTADCIRLLKAELARRPSYAYTINNCSTGNSATITYLTPRGDDGPEAIGAVA